MLTLKLTALLALSSATRAQILVFLNIESMTVYEDGNVFVFNDLLKTSRPYQSYTLKYILQPRRKHLCYAIFNVYFWHKVKHIPFVNTT